MRLHRLEVTAFGPFAGTETVDFDALTESGLFLLRGPTGAGKTSVLDAVCFALYGSVPGTRQRGGALRSDHARPELLTRVVLELTLAGRRLRITRQPEQRRPKQRGEGTTLVRPQTLLEEWEPAAGFWSARSGSHQEIGQELHDLVGMSRDQFCQVVLLPQGEFARFLHAPAQERRELLGRLFDTRRFTGAERWLQERTRLSERGVRDAEAELDAFTHRLDQAAGELTDAVPPLADRAAWAAQLRCEARERAGVAESAEALREEARRAAEERSAAAARLAERQQAYARAVAEQQRLADGQTAELARGVRLTLNRRAESVAPLARLAARAEAESAAAGREAAALHAVLPEPERALTAGELVARERELRGEAGRLEALAETEAALHAEAAEADRLERQREEVERQHRAAAAWLAEVWPERQAKAQAALAEARAEAGAVEHLAEERDRARSRVRAAEERDALDAEAARSRAAATAARDEEQRLRDVWLDLKERRLAGMAAELASQLVAGKPCAVCGGTEHPAPAQAAGEAVTPEAEQTAEAAYLAARERTEAAQAALSGVEQRLAAARAEAGPQPAEELRSRAAELDARHREAEHQAVAAVRAEEELALLEQQHERHLAAASRAANSLAVLEEQLDQLARRQTGGQARLEEACAGAASVADRVRTVTALADSCAAAAEAERSASALAAQAADA
ncbi:AAA family ATPase, partial [Streptacidiphilus monticola]